jgi:sigma-B regulation protein RsbQ
VTDFAAQDVNNFCSGHLVVSPERKIIFCNTYASDLSGQQNGQLVNSAVSDCFTKASNIFIDSYIYPFLLNDSFVEESQMSWLTQKGEVVPVVVNIRLGEDGVSYWSIYVCANRDQLYDELIKAKTALEKQSEELYQLATTDPLTGLLNRRELLLQVKKITSQVERNASTVALLSVDVDFFKDVNDTYGHQAGDKVLKLLADILIEGRRANDLVARVGGKSWW